LQDLTEIRLETSAAVAVVTATATSINRANRPAILRKDFVVNRYMIAQAAAAGADSVLLIVAVLSEWLLSDLILYCRTQFQMEPLVEVHSDDELDVALRAGAKVIGVNNRNLHTFQLDLTTSERMAARLTSMGLSFRPVSNSDSKDDTTATTPPPQYALCALSGMSTCYDVDRYRQAGLSMCLIGESLMRAADPQAAIASLCLNAADFTKMTSGGKGSSSTDGVVDAATASTTVAAYTQGTQLVKVCGITNADDALVACRAGAQLIGVIFVPKSPRCVATTEQAQAIVQTVRAFGERSDRCDFGTLPTAVNGSPIAQLRQSSDALAQTVRQRPVVVGVFQNQDAQYIRDMVQDCGLDMVQLHGGEGMAAANRHNFGVPVIRVVDISVDPTTGAKMTTTDDPVPAVLQGITHDPAVILLDTAIKGGSGGGGTGLIFDWSIASRLQDAGLPVIVAGGLTAESVPDCVTRIRPFGVDVSSGVEAAPGRKDHDKVQQFVSGAKMAAAQAQKGF
jgi:phosphoribosylanthranilate isomerase/indole-3-glycerol phosphate synthase